VTGKFKTVTVTGTDLKQTNVGVDFQLVWTRPITDRFLASPFLGGPDYHSRLSGCWDDRGGLWRPDASPSSERQSATTAKGGKHRLSTGYSR
jgi:hypothetical protein